MSNTHSRKPSRNERKLKKEASVVRESKYVDDYWPRLIIEIRSNEGWTQSRFAKVVRTNQETVSRWEAGIVKPSAEKAALIERFAKRALPTALKEIGFIIKSSPYPIILTDSKHMVIAASKASGFKARKTIAEQTPEDEIIFFEKFANSLRRRGFWKRGGQRFNYKYVVDGIPRQAVVVSIALNREVFAVVQQGSSG